MLRGDCYCMVGNFLDQAAVRQGVDLVSAPNMGTRASSGPNMGTRASSGDTADQEAIPDTGSGRRSRPTGLRSWLVSVQQKIALLFPAELETRRRFPVVVIVLAYLLMIAVGAGALLLRQAGEPSWNTIWGEDGWLLLPGAISHPLSAILRPYAGYVQVFPRLTADLIASLPFRDAAAGFAIAGAVVAAAIGAFAYKACSGHVRNRAMRLMLGASVVLLPTGILEVANSGINTPWYGLFALFWALIWRPRSWAGMTVVAFIGLAVMSSQIVGALLLPLLIARLIALPRVREHAVTIGYIAGAGFQVAGVLQAKNPTQLSHPGRDWSFVVRHMLDVAAGGQHFTVWLLHHAGHSLGTALLCAFVAAIFAWALVLGNARVRVFSVAVAGSAFLLSYLPALYRTKVTVPTTGPLGHLWVRGDRYTVTPILIIISAMIIIADAALSREGSRLFWRRRRLQVTSAAAACVLIACVIATWATDYRYIVARSYYASWSASVDYAAQSCAEGYHPYLSAVRAWVPCDWLDPNRQKQMLNTHNRLRQTAADLVTGRSPGSATARSWLHVTTTTI